jgi:hypothetical protein
LEHFYMSCAAIAITLAQTVISNWTMTGVPVQVCVYQVGTEKHIERQVGLTCTKQPKKKISEQTLRLAEHNACAAPTARP